MRITIDCRSILLPQRTGIGRSLYQLLDALGRLDAVNEYVLYARKRLWDRRRQIPNFSGYKNFRKQLDFFKRGPGKTDLYHLPAPDGLPSYQGRLVVTIHDLVYKMYPQGHTADTIALTDQYLKMIVKQADYIICISENTRRDFHATFDFPLEKSCVVYNGVNKEVFYPLPQEERLQAKTALKTLGVDRPYILFVGTIEPRKNLAGLLESFAILKKRKIFDGQLVVAGMPGWMMSNLQDLLKKWDIQRDVVLTGFVSDETLCQLYNMTEVFVFPSFYEGFGIPLLEAFSCGAAVVSSHTSSCPEVVGQAALMVDPGNPNAMARAIGEIVQDTALKKRLSEAGMNRANTFSFEKMARETLKVYQQQAFL